MDFSITATVVHVSEGSTTYQVPAFVLPNMLSRENAIAVAEEIINPTKNPSLILSVDAQPWRD
jgi:hypothetical protein